MEAETGGVVTGETILSPGQITVRTTIARSAALIAVRLTSSRSRGSINSCHELADSRRGELSQVSSFVRHETPLRREPPN